MNAIVQTVTEIRNQLKSVLAQLEDIENSGAAQSECEDAIDSVEALQVELDGMLSEDDEE